MVYVGTIIMNLSQRMEISAFQSEIKGAYVLPYIRKKITRNSSYGNEKASKPNIEGRGLQLNVLQQP